MLSTPLAETIATEDATEDEIDTCLRKLPSLEAIKELFWSILEYTPEYSVIPLTALNNTNRKKVTELRLFGSRGAQKLLIVRLAGNSFPAGRDLQEVFRNLRMSFPYALLLLTNSTQSDWRLAYYSPVDPRKSLVLRIGVHGSLKALRRVIAGLSPEAQAGAEDTTLADVNRLDQTLLDSWLKTFARELDEDITGTSARSAYRWWCDLASRTAVLSKSEEQELFHRLEELWPRHQRRTLPLFGEAKRIFDTLVLSNLRFVLYVVKNDFWAQTEKERMDLVQEGNHGMIVALKKFDPARKHKFISYAVYYIKANIHKYIVDMTDMIRLPVNIRKDLQTMKSKQDEMLAQLHREPSTCEIGKEMGRNESFVVNLLHLPRVREDFEDLHHSEDSAITYHLQSASLEQRDYRRLAALILKRCNDRERMILVQRFGLHDCEEMTLEEIGSSMGRTRERIRQIATKTLKRFQTPETISRLKWMLG